MCGRYTVTKAQEVLGVFFGAEFSETHIPIYNACPGQRLPVILDSDPRRVVPARWGLARSSPARPARFIINARSETVDRLSAFRESFERRRCLAIADGFYEWQAVRDGKRPFRIACRTGEPFAFAGVWQEVGGQPAFVILTTDANGVVRPIHDRMPVILARNEMTAWLSRDVPSPDLLRLLDPFPDGLLTSYPVSAEVNSPRNQGPELIDPVDPVDPADPVQRGLFPQ